METRQQTLQEKAQQHFQSGEFTQAAALYEQMIEYEPDQVSHYWYLGLTYLLQNNEADAQTTWLYGLSQGNELQQSKWLAELQALLAVEADRQNELEHPESSWLVRQHIREFEPGNLTNLLKLICLSIELDKFDSAHLVEWNVIELLENSVIEVSSELLLKTLEKITQKIDQPILNFAQSCLQKLQGVSEWLTIYLEIARKTGFDYGQYSAAIELLNSCLLLQPNNIDLITFLARYQLKVYEYKAAIISVKKAIFFSQTPIQKSFANTLLLKVLIAAGQWGEVREIASQYLQDIHELQNLPEIQFDSGLLQALIVSNGDLAYIQDNLAENRFYQNLVANLFKVSAQKTLPQFDHRQRSKISFCDDSTRKIKIGYIGSTFSPHSVSWLNRWVFAHHNKKEFEIHIYAFGEVLSHSFFQTWFEPHAHFITESRSDVKAMMNKIYKDEIDILVDLDSYTRDYTCTVMAAKPAPIQVTWLGNDASGLSTIDYFIADPYVLPEHAQVHYQEKIWRLPQTYIAVDGFEVSSPTLRREDLDITTDAIIYFSSQTALKRNPETVRLQLEIIKQVPNSYLLIKGLGDPVIIKAYFTELAHEVGLNPDRLRFLADCATEYEHRANLQIADVILDTYPYSGATTTLEALWVGVPLVTRLGETFSSRNSYAFLMNAGVTEGIAQSAQEYLDWGVRFGTDEALRKEVAWKLYQSRNISSLWDAKQFTRDLEVAYKQMWQHYCDK
jgi:predicted O-linked N-acetylglucosamine transferase (SPINDLY family)